MYAITFESHGGPEQLRWSEVPSPQAGPGEVRIRTAGAGVNRADLLQLAGHYPPPPGASGLLGLECSGVIDQIGPGVADWRLGDPVVALLPGGGYAEYVTVGGDQVAPAPPAMALVSAAGVLEVAATVLANLDRAQLQAGDLCLVHGGAGGIGSFAIQYAQRLGARVATTASAGKLAHCRALGAEIVLDYRTDWLAELLTATGGRGADVILDIIGAKYLDANLTALAEGGRLVIIGMQKGTRAELNIARLLAKQGLIMATSLRNRSAAEKARIVARVVEEIWPRYADGSIEPSPETRFPLPEAARALTALASGEVIGKVVLATPGHA